MKLNIAIDGPAGSGKSTVAKAIARALNITYLDTGAMYRMVTLNVINKGLAFEDEPGIQALLNHMTIEINPESFYLNGQDVSTEIRSSDVAKHVSKIAAMGFVREKLVAIQREIAEGKNIIMDGRDIGTHVLPNANFKFFLVASVEERAKRRMKDFEAQNIDITMEELMEDIKSRDEQDSNRKVSPLRQAHDAILVDTTKMSIDEVIEYIIDRVKG
jgi:cytidylate kinase